MSDSITLTEAINQLYDTVEARAIPSMRGDVKRQRERALGDMVRDYRDRIGPVFEAKWERGWGCSCTLEIEAIETTRRGEPDISIQASVSWSSTGHGIASALTAVTLYREVVELGALLETQWARWRVVPDAEKEAAQ